MAGFFPDNIYRIGIYNFTHGYFHVNITAHYQFPLEGLPYFAAVLFRI